MIRWFKHDGGLLHHFLEFLPMVNQKMDPADISIIVTSHYDGPMLESCLRGVLGIEPQPCEVIVVVDGADPAVISRCETLGVRSIPLSSAPGVSAARNVGARMAAGILLAFLDSDVRPPADFISRVISIANGSPSASAFFGSYDDTPAAPGLVSVYRNLLHHYTHHRAKRRATTFWAGCGVCRRDVFLELGGFDETFRKPSVEDIEFGYRLSKAGHEIVCDPTLQVCHLKRWRFRDLVITDLFCRAIPWSILIQRRRRLNDDLNIDHRSRWSAFLCLLMILSTGLSLSMPWLWLISLLCLVGVIAWNLDFYRFLAAKKGWLFAAACVPLQLIYFLIGGTGFAVAGILRIISTPKSLN